MLGHFYFQDRRPFWFFFCYFSIVTDFQPPPSELVVYEEQINCRCDLSSLLLESEAASRDAVHMVYAYTYPAF